MTYQFIPHPRVKADAFAVCAPAPLFAPARCGAYGWLTPAIAAIAGARPGFARTALAVPRSEQHFIGLCVALMGARGEDADHLAAFARGYGVLSRRSLLGGCDPALEDSVVGALAKAAPRIAGSLWRPATYRRLAVLVKDAQARKALRHMPAVTRRDVLTLSRLPTGFRSIGVLRKVRRRSLAETTFAIELVRRVRTDLDDRRILQSLEKSTALVDDWARGHFEKAPFPPAPVSALVIDGVEALRPLTSFADLKRAALEFDNCIRTYLYQVLRGDVYFYRYAPMAGGSGVAIVELRRMPVIGWVVHEAQGPLNDSISGRDRCAIIAAFRKAGIIPAPQATNPNSWFELA